MFMHFIHAIRPETTRASGGWVNPIESGDKVSFIGTLRNLLRGFAAPVAWDIDLDLARTT
jgi:hypothetical protein